MGFRESLSIFDWDQESHPKFEDFLALTVFALFFPTVRYFLDRFVFEVKFVDLLIIHICIYIYLFFLDFDVFSIRVLVTFDFLLE